MLVELDYTLWVARLSADGAPRAFTTITDAALLPNGYFPDEQGSVLFLSYVGGFETEETIVVLHDHDLESFSSLANWHTEVCGAALGTLMWGDRTFDIEPTVRVEVAKRYGFVTRPAEQPRQARRSYFGSVLSPVFSSRY